LQRLFEQNSYDLVHAHYLSPDGAIAYYIWKKFGIPYIITFRNQDRQYIESISSFNLDFIKAKKILSNSKAVIVPNKGYQSFIQSKFSCSSELIPNGLDKKYYLSPEYEINSNNEVIILTVTSKAIKTKNVDWVVEAVANYTGIKKISLHVIGIGEIIDRLKESYSKHRNIHFLGQMTKTDVINQMRISHIFALPSERETFGMVYLEAAANKNAIIGYKEEGIWGVLNDKKEAIFCDGKTTFLKQLSRLIDDTKLQESLSKHAYQKSLTLEWSAISKKYLQVYRLNDVKRNV